MWRPLLDSSGADVGADAASEPDIRSGCRPTSPTPGTANTERTALLSGPGPDDPSTADMDTGANHDDGPERVSNPVGLWRGLAIGLSLWLVVFLEATNMSGMAIIQGPIAQALGAPSLAPWFTTAYLIAMSSMAPVFGRLAAIFSPRALILPVTVLFAAGALLASQAPSVVVFLAGRVVAGCGAGGVLSLSVIFVLALVSKERRGVCIGVVNAGITAGVSFGAVVYGALISVVGWRPLFWMQAPCVLAAGLAVYLSTPSTMKPGAQYSESSLSSKDELPSVGHRLSHIDYLGAFLLTLTIVLFLYGLADIIHPLPLLLSPFSLLAFLAAEWRLASTPNQAGAGPIIPLPILSSRSVLLSCLAQLGLMSARWSLLYFSPIYMLAVRGSSAAGAGSILVPTNLGFTVGGIAVGWLHIRRAGSFWLPCLVAFAGFALSLLALAAVAGPSPSSPFAAMVAAVFVNGVTTGAALNYTLAHLLHLCHPGTEYVATSLLATFRGFGGSFGTSIGGGVFYRFLHARLTNGFRDIDGGKDLTSYHRELVSRLQGLPQLVFYGDLSPRDQQIALQGYDSAIKSVWRLAACLVVIVIIIQAATGWTGPERDVRVEVEDDD